MRRKTALARFIDTCALWSVCAVLWAYYLARRAGGIYAALPLAAICAAATIALCALLMRGLRTLRQRRCGARIDAAQARALCEHVALMDSSDALNSIASWLTARGRYAQCSACGGAILARRADGSRAAIALIGAWPGECAGADAVIGAWRSCTSALEQARDDAHEPCNARHGSCDIRQNHCARLVISTAPLSDEAQSLARRLGLRLIAPEALAELMAEALPLCGEAAPRRARLDAWRAAFGRISAARMGAWALGLCVGGRLLGLPYCRATGLICALVWLLRAAQPRAKRMDSWE